MIFFYKSSDDSESNNYKSMDNNYSKQELTSVTYDFDGDDSDLSQETIYDAEDDDNRDDDPTQNRLHDENFQNVEIPRRTKQVNEIKQYRELATIMQQYPLDPSTQFEKMYKLCKTSFRFDLLPVQQQGLRKKIMTFKTHYNQKWKHHNRTHNRFNGKEKEWLKNYITVPISWIELLSTPRRKQGTITKNNSEENLGPSQIPGQKKSFEELCTRVQRKAVQKI